MHKTVVQWQDCFENLNIYYINFLIASQLKTQWKLLTSYSVLEKANKSGKKKKVMKETENVA